MEKSDGFRKVEKMLFDFKTYDIAIRSLQAKIDSLSIPNCISNYSSDPVSYTVGNTSDSTAKHGMDRVAQSLILDAWKDSLKQKVTNRDLLLEIIPLFDQEEQVIWVSRYIKGDSPVKTQVQYAFSKTTYFRIRKRLVLKVMTCLGEI